MESRCSLDRPRLLVAGLMNNSAVAFEFAGAGNFIRKQTVFSRETRFISGRCKECSHENPIKSDQRRYLSPLVIEKRTGGCRGHHLDESHGTESVRADKTHP